MLGHIYSTLLVERKKFLTEKSHKPSQLPHSPQSFKKKYRLFMLTYPITAQ